MLLLPLFLALPAGNILPVTVYDQRSFRVLFHFAQGTPAGRPDILVVVISMLSTAPLPVTGISFQAAVPKVGWGGVYHKLLLPHKQTLCHL